MVILTEEAEENPNIPPPVLEADIEGEEEFVAAL